MSEDEQQIEEALGICCGNTDDMRNHIHKTLRLLLDRSNANSGSNRTADGWEKGTKALVTHLGDLYSPMTTVYLHYLDRLGLIEHGCGIAGSWLTPEGITVLGRLEALKIHD